MNYIKIDDKAKAAIFTHDARVFVRSLSDAIICTQQIAAINCNKEMYLKKISTLDQSQKSGTLLLAKYCDHDICNVNLIASKSFNSYYTYFMMKFSVNLFLNFFQRLNTTRDYFALNKELDFILDNLREDLKRYIIFTKRKHLIFTKENETLNEEKNLV
jgi:hypothetical protein